MVGVTAVTTKMAPKTLMLQVMKDWTEYDTEVSTDSVSLVNLHHTTFKPYADENHPKLEEEFWSAHSAECCGKQAVQQLCQSASLQLCCDRRCVHLIQYAKAVVSLCLVQRCEHNHSRCDAYLLSRRPVGWLSKKAIGRRMTLANRLACSLREALKEPSTSSRALPPCTNKDTRPRVK